MTAMGRFRPQWWVANLGMRCAKSEGLSRFICGNVRSIFGAVALEWATGEEPWFAFYQLPLHWHRRPLPAGRRRPIRRPAPGEQMPSHDRRAALTCHLRAPISLSAMFLPDASCLALSCLTMERPASACSGRKRRDRHNLAQLLGTTRFPARASPPLDFP